MIACNRWNALAYAVVLSLLLMGVVPAAAAAGSVLFLTPDTGPLSEVAAAMAQELVAQGVMPQFAEAIPADLGPETVVLTDDDHLVDEAARMRLMTHLQGGGGVVLLVQPSPTHYAQANLLLGLLGALAEEVSAGDTLLRLGDNPVTGGVAFAVPVTSRLRLSGSGLRPLAWVGEDAAIAHLSVHQGGLIVLPAAPVVSGLRRQPPDRAGLTIAVRAAQWANRLGEVSAPGPAAAGTPAAVSGGPAGVPVAATSLPLESKDFAGAVLYDSLAADDLWPQINELVVEMLKKHGLDLKALDVRPGRPAPALVPALDSGPVLAVLGSWRPLTEPETMALYYYVLGGGRLLALGNATTATQSRLVELNRGIYPLGVFLSLGRPGGEARLVPAALPGSLPEPGTLPSGIWVGGPAAEPVVLVGERAALVVATCGRGRVMALDARALLANPDYGAVLREGIKWLLSPES